MLDKLISFALRQRVFVLDAQGQPQAVPVRTGDTNGSQTEVTSGELQPNAQVITGRLAAGPQPAASTRGAPGGR